MTNTKIPPIFFSPDTMRSNLTWSLLLAVVMLLMASVASLLWFAWREEVSNRNEQVISDTLWVKQNIEFQLNRHAEAMRDIAFSAERGSLIPAAFSAKARSLLESNREIARIALIDALGNVVLAESAHSMQGTIAKVAEADEAQLTHDVLLRGRELYAEVLKENPPLLRLGIPVLSHLSLDTSPKVIVITYSLEGVLNELVPWWLARENQVAFSDAYGDKLVEHQPALPARGIFRHQMPMSLQNAGLLLMVDSLQDNPRIIPHAMSATIVGLTLTLVLSLVLLWRDMRRREQAERGLSEQLTFRKTMENSLVTGLRARDMQGCVTYVNPAFCHIVGFSADELIGRSWPMPFHGGPCIDALRERFEQMLAGTISPQGYETEFIHKDGHSVHVLIHEAPLLDTTGRQTGWMGSILDVTEHKRIEELSRHQQEKLQATARLVTMGEVATTLSHELNQPLSAITSYATGCLNLIDDERHDVGARVGQRSLLHEALTKIQHQSERAGHIIRLVHGFVQRREPNKVMGSISDIIESSMPLIQLQASKGQVKVKTNIASELPPVHADAMMLELVLLNLTRNAIEAMAGQPPERRRLIIDAQWCDEAIVVSVIDHGCGVELSEGDKLFSPFFTTKSEGMGMGLNICRTAIEFHRGRLWHEATPEGGATFRFTLQS